MDILFATSLILGIASVITPFYVGYRLLTREVFPSAYLRNSILFLLALSPLSIIATFVPSNFFGVNITNRVPEIWMLVSAGTTLLLISLLLLNKKLKVILWLVPNILWAIFVSILLIYFTLYPVELYMMG